IELSEEPIINNESVVKNNHEAPEQVFVEPENEIEEMLQFKEELEATNEVEIEIELEEPVIELSEEPIINNESVVENNHEAPEQTPLENHGIKIEEELPENLKIALSLEKQEFRIENSDEDNIESNHEEVESVIQSELKPESTSEQQKERPSIPFNVIMLKQDKQKLMMKESSPLSGQETIIEKTQPQEQEAQKVLEFEKLEETKESENEETFYTVNNDMIQMKEVETTKHFFPPIDLLNPPLIVEGNDEWIDEQARLLDSTLKNFNVGAQVVKVTQGPAVTRFEVQPEPGVKVNKITNLSDDIKLSLAARDIRIEAPIPGKHTIGIEVPNQKSRAVNISEIINHMEFEQKESPLTAVLGLDISGKPVVTDLRKMPHGLIAGATGSGKSVCINTILISLLYKATPNELKLLLIDPKMVELAPYNHIPHLVSPVITDVKAATASLKWAVEEMERRYELFAHSGVRDIGRFNELAKQHRQFADILPYIVIVIDELADLMMMSPADVEEAISRIAQKARACGIHLIIATQRPSVDVITGLIKANIPTRIAFSVSSQIDSRTIIDISGAEKLLGRGDMLFLENGASKPVRIQGTFVSDDEIDQVVAHVRTQGEPEYLFQQEELLKKAQVEEDGDELFYDACEFVVDHGGASTSLLQRRFKIGYNRAARLIDLMEVHGYISESKGSKPRDVFLTDTDLEALQ
ncbi:MAG: DNA translocase FtsK, partial [Bacillus sp. (in: firmicutes)]